MTNTYSENAWLWKRGLLLSAVLTLFGFIVAMTVSGYRSNDSNVQQASVGAGGEQFAPTSREELEAIYHNAWLAARDNFADQGKLADWTQWESRYHGRIRTERQLVLAIQDMLSSLGDKHTTVLTTRQWAAFENAHSGKVIGIGIGLRQFTIANVMPNTPAAQAGLKAGDNIIAVDGDPVATMQPEQMTDHIRGPEGTPVVLTIAREGKLHDVSLTRAVVKQDPSIRTQTWSTNAVRVDNLRSDSVVTEMDKALTAQQKPLILDLRGSKGGSGQTAAQVAALFLKEGTITRSLQRINGKDVTVTYAVKDGKLVKTTQVAGTADDIATIDTPVNRHSDKLVVLVDDQTTGAAELIAGALKDNHRATVVGIKTAGKGNAQVNVPLNEKFLLRVTNAHYFTPSGAGIDGAGVTPDQPVDPKQRGTLFHEAISALAAGK